MDGRYCLRTLPPRGRIRQLAPVHCDTSRSLDVFLLPNVNFLLTRVFAEARQWVSWTRTKKHQMWSQVGWHSQESGAYDLSRDDRGTRPKMLPGVLPMIVRVTLTPGT